VKAVEGWNKTDLDSVISAIQSGSRPKGGVTNDRGDIPSLGGENIINPGGITLGDVKLVSLDFYYKMTKGHLQDGDVLINKDGAQTGKVGFYKSPTNQLACINEHLFILRGIPNRIEQKYLYYTLLSQSGQHQIRSQISGSAQPGLKSGFIKGLMLDLPALLPEQAKIAEILSTVDRAIEQTEALIAKQQRIKTGLMQDLLTRGIDENGNLRSEQTHQFKDSPFGRVPLEWEVKTLDSCVRKDGPICYGILMPGSGYDNGVPVIKVKDIVGGKILQNNLLLTDPKTDSQYKRSKLRESDLLITIRGTTGRVAIVPPELEGANITQDTARIRLKEEHSNLYFYFLLQSKHVQDQVLLHTLGQAVGNVQKCLHGLKID